MNDEHLWALRGKFLYSLLRERSTPDNRAVLEIDEMSPGPAIWVKPEGTEEDWLAAVDHAMEEA